MDEPKIFVEIERFIDVQVYRERSKLHASFRVVDAGPMATDEQSVARLVDSIKSALAAEDPPEAEVVTLPAAEGRAADIMIALTMTGPLASQRTRDESGLSRRIFFRPLEELLLVYSPEKGLIEVCGRDATEQRIAARAMAEVLLGVDLHHNPLSQLIFDLTAFRKGFTFEVPAALRSEIEAISVREISLGLGKNDRVVLQCPPDGNVSSVIDRAFAGRLPHGSWLMSVGMSVLRPGNAKPKRVNFTISGRNRSSLQSIGDHDARELGFRVLAELGVMRRVVDLPVADILQLLPHLFVLHDLPEGRHAGSGLAGMSLPVGELVSAGYLLPAEQLVMIDYDDEAIGHVLLEKVEGPGEANATGLLAPSLPGPELPLADVTTYTVKQEFVRQRMIEALAPLGLRGSKRAVAGTENLLALGIATLDGLDVPIFLARRLYDPSVLKLTDHLCRASPQVVRGIVFTSMTAPLDYLGPHVVLNIADCLGATEGQIDPEVVRIAYTQMVAVAAGDKGVVFQKNRGDQARKNGSAILVIPGQDLLIIVGETRVRIFECLYLAWRSGQPEVRTGEIQSFAKTSNLSSVFGDDLKRYEGRYFRRSRGHYALAVP